MTRTANQTTRSYVMSQQKGRPTRPQGLNFMSQQKRTSWREASILSPRRAAHDLNYQLDREALFRNMRQQKRTCGLWVGVLK